MTTDQKTPKINSILERAESKDKENVAKAKEFILDSLNNNPTLTSEFLKIVNEKIEKALNEKSKIEPTNALRSDLGIKESVYLSIGVKEEKLSGVLGKEDILDVFITACRNITTDSIYYSIWDGISMKKEDTIKSKYPEGTFKDALYEVTRELYPEWVQIRSLKRDDE
jgi:hypothetical protein